MTKKNGKPNLKSGRKPGRSAERRRAVTQVLANRKRGGPGQNKKTST